MMIEIIQVLDLVATARLSVPTRHGLCELKTLEQGTAPAKYTANGSWDIVSVDSGGDWSYWRILSPVKEATDNRIVTCDVMLTQTQTLRLVTLVDRTLCDNLADVARATASDMRRAREAVRVATKAAIVEISTANIDVDTTRVFAQEFNGAGFGSVNPNKALVAIDIVVAITGREACFDVCGTPTDVTCAIIDAASNAKVEECLGAERIAEICDSAPCPDLCDLVAPADPSDVVACVEPGNIPDLLCVTMNTDEATPEAIVVCLDGAGKTDAVKAIICDPCPECDPLTVTINDVDMDPVSDPCGAALGLKVRNSNNGLVGSAIGGAEWRAPDATYQLKDSAGTNIGAASTIPSGTSANVTAPDAQVQLKDSAGVKIGLADSYLSNSSNNKTAPDGTVTINNSVPTLLHTVAVKSNGAATQAIADSIITKPDGTTVGLPATVALDVRTYKSGIVYQFGYGLWSGVTTAYRTGGEGYLYAQGWFDYTRPAYPESFAALAGVFDTLAANNIYGNTRRFTDRAGAAPATSGDRYIRDHLTGCEWWRPSSMPSFTNWNNAVDNSAGATDGGETDWWLPPIKVLNTIADNSLADPFNYGGFLVTDPLWSSTTNGANTAFATRMIGSSNAGPQIGVLKTSTNRYLFVRKFL